MTYTNFVGCNHNQRKENHGAKGACWAAVWCQSAAADMMNAMPIDTAVSAAMTMIDTAGKTATTAAAGTQEHRGFHSLSVQMM